MEEKPANGRSTVLLISGAASVFILLLEAIIVVTAGWPENTEGWGNFLAGAFAPLAFVWLIAAVFIQSNELREQRAELQLTRREFEQNRKVMENQAEEARRQAEFVGQQTEYLKAQQAEKDYRGTLSTLKMCIDVYRGGLLIRTQQDQHTTKLSELGENLKEEEMALRLNKNLEKFFERIGPGGRLHGNQWKTSDQGGLSMIVAAVDRCMDSSKRLRDTDRIQTAAIGLGSLQKNLHALQDLVKPTQ